MLPECTATSHRWMLRTSHSYMYMQVVHPRLLLKAYMYMYVHCMYVTLEKNQLSGWIHINFIDTTVSLTWCNSVTSTYVCSRTVTKLIKPFNRNYFTHAWLAPLNQLFYAIPGVQSLSFFASISNHLKNCTTLQGPYHLSCCLSPS